jgi:hypothetical protein
VNFVLPKYLSINFSAETGIISKLYCNLFGIKDKHPMSDEKLYLEVTEEVEGNNKNPALWAKSMALSEGDQEKAKYLYIKLRVEHLKSDRIDKSSATVTVEPTNFFSKLAKGELGLAKTYWLYGVLVGIVVSIISNVITSIGGLIILMLAHTAYSIPVLMGIWRASSKYQGLKVWAILAKVAVVFGVIMLVVGLFFAGTDNLDPDKLFHRLRTSLTIDEKASADLDHCAPGLTKAERLRLLAQYGAVRETIPDAYTAGDHSVYFNSYDGSLTLCR